ncbi:MAG: ISKra4 family transposase [Pseudomonadota bacterium]
MLQHISRQPSFDLEAVESALRTAILAAGARLLAKLLEDVGEGRRNKPVVCACGMPMWSWGLEEKTVLTILGEVRFSRSRYECPRCHAFRYPGDEELGVRGTSRSPGVRRMMARAGSRQTFKEARDDLGIYAGVQVSAKDVERVAEGIGEKIEVWQSQQREFLLTGQLESPSCASVPTMYIEMDGTGVPMTRQELAGRKGKQADGTSRTREAKLGCVFTQTELDEKGRPRRDLDTTSFVGAIETVEDFGARIEAEAIRRGLSDAKEVIVLGDGAVWIRGLVEHRFPQATQIIDLFHSKEHVANLVKLLFGTDEKKVLKYRLGWRTDLEAGLIEKIIKEAQKKRPRQGETRKKVNCEIHYLDENKERMRYAEFRKKGWFVGSGVIEAGCKSIIGPRLKQSGMEWSLRGANAIISLRCTMLSERFEDFWEERAA